MFTISPRRMAVSPCTMNRHVGDWQANQAGDKGNQTNNDLYKRIGLSEPISGIARLVLAKS